jgi:3-oxoacyl-[acyl-carrier protein] reductase
MTGRNAEKLNRAASMLGCDAIEFDVTDQQQAQAVKTHLAEKYGKLDVLINNAAFVRLGKIDETEPAIFWQVLQTNVYGAFLSTQTMLPLLRLSDNALVINVCSTAGHRANPLMPAYNASKYGLIGLTESVREDLRKENIRVTTISPSAIRFEGDTTEDHAGRIQGDDVAQVALFLAKSPARALFRDVEIWSTNSAR